MRSLPRHTFVAILLCLVTLVAYWGSLHAGFVWDDNFQIVKNPYLHADQPVTKLLFSDVWGYTRGSQASQSNYYRPLQMLVYRATYETAGLAPGVFHGVNILFNCLAVLAAYWLLLELTRREIIAAAAAILFAVHPIHSEAVLWIAALTELGCALFYFVAFASFLHAGAADAEVPEPERKKKRKTKAPANASAAAHRRWWIAASVAAFAVALLWKEMALTFPLVVVAYVLLTSSAPDWRRRAIEAARRSFPFWCVVAAYIPLRIAVLGYFSKVQHRWSLSPLEFLANTAVLTGEYFWRMLLPIRLNAFHVFHPVRSMTDPRLLAAVLFLAAAAAGVLFFARRRPLPTFAAVWALITLIPVLNVQGVGENVFAERYLYIPSVGLILLAVWCVAELFRKLPPTAMKIAATAAMLLIATASIAEIRARVPDWQSDLALYQSTLRLSPDAALVHNSLGQIWLDTGDLDAAQREYEAALKAAESQQNPTQAAGAYLGLSSTAWHRGDAQRGLELAEAGLKIEPDAAALQIAHGILLLQLGRMDEAKSELQRAVQFAPFDEVPLNALGAIAIAQKDYNAALDYFQRSVVAVPTFSHGYNNLGRTYLEMGRLSEAVPNFKRAVDLDPGNPTFLTNYGIALSRSGDRANARLELQRALSVDPNNAAAQMELARLGSQP